MQELLKKVKMTIQSIVKIGERIEYIIKKKIYNFLYRQVTYIPEKGIWVSTVVFPIEITDGICGVTDAFRGNKYDVDYDAVHTVYIKKASDSYNTHKKVVEFMKMKVLSNELIKS